MHHLIMGASMWMCGLGTRDSPVPSHVLNVGQVQLFSGRKTRFSNGFFKSYIKILFSITALLLSFGNGFILVKMIWQVADVMHTLE